MYKKSLMYTFDFCMIMIDRPDSNEIASKSSNERAEHVIHPENLRQNPKLYSMRTFVVLLAREKRILWMNNCLLVRRMSKLN